MVAGLVAPVTSTGVPTGSDAGVEQPSVAVLPPGAGAVRGLAEVRARAVGVDEVRGALRAVGERLDARMDRARAPPRAAAVGASAMVASAQARARTRLSDIPLPSVE